MRRLAMIIFLLFIYKLGFAAECRSLSTTTVKDSYQNQTFIIEHCSNSREQYIKTNFNNRTITTDISSIEYKFLMKKLREVVHVFSKEVPRTCSTVVNFTIHVGAPETIQFCRKTQNLIFEKYLGIFNSYHRFDKKP